MDDGYTPYGFKWGPMEISRAIRIPGRGRSLEVWVTDDHGTRQRVQIYCSEAGRKVRVFLGNEEMFPQRADQTQEGDR
jgi:hypothetical protein